MADKVVSRLPPPSTEDLRIAAGRFEYANRATVGGNYDIAIGCLRTSCRLVPGNLSYRQALRKVEKTKYKNNRRGSALAPLTTLTTRMRLLGASRRKEYRKVLEYGEAILARNPWDKGAQLHMARAADALGMEALAIWILQQAREKDPKDVDVNRALARLLEKDGHFQQAITMWELVRKARPQDVEAQDKAKELAATATIARGNYAGAAQNAGEAVATRTAGAEPPPKALGKPGVADTQQMSPVKTREAREEAVLRARLADDPGNVDAYVRLAALHVRHGQLAEARSLLEQGLEATRGAFEVAVALADLEVEPLRQQLARTEEQLKLKPQEAKLQKAHAELAAQINARELECFRLKAEHDTEDRTSRYELGVRLLRAGQVEEAIGVFQAVRAEPRLRWKALMQLGYCFKARQNWPLARRNFEEALSGMPGGEETPRKELLFCLAEGYADGGELPRAMELAMELANLDYGFRNIGRLLEEWQGRAQGNNSVKATGK